MARTYDAQSLVDLPRMDAATGAALATAIGSAAAGEKKLAPNVAAAVQTVHTRNVALKAVLMAELTAAPESELGKSMRAEAATWAGIESWLQGIARAGGAAKAHTAQKLLSAVYPEGLSFLRGTAVKRWTGTEARMQFIEKNDLAADFVQLGGIEMLQNLHAVHNETGIKAGITTAKPVVETSPVREKANALKAALRSYVLQVAANAALDPTDAGQALAAKLLQPLADYVAPEANKATGMTSGDTATPAG
jgi:hypothetical protein